MHSDRAAHTRQALRLADTASSLNPRRFNPWLDRVWLGNRRDRKYADCLAF